MLANGGTRRRWTAALFASLIAHAILLATVQFVPIPANLAVEETTQQQIAILRITKAVTAHGHRGSAPAAPRIAPRPHAADPAAASHGVAVRGSAHAKTDAEAGTSRAASGTPSRTAPAGNRGNANSAGPPANGTPGASNATEEPSPEPAPTLTTEMLAKLNVRMREALPSAVPQTMKHYTSETTIAIRPDPNRLSAANYPLPNSGLFAHAHIVRTEREAIAVRAIQRIGNAYICIGYLAKIDADHPAKALAGPYIGPCKRAWREQLGLTTKPSPLPEPQPTASP